MEMMSLHIESSRPQEHQRLKQIARSQV